MLEGSSEVGLDWVGVGWGELKCSSVSFLGPKKVHLVSQCFLQGWELASPMCPVQKSFLKEMGL